MGTYQSVSKPTQLAYICSTPVNSRATKASSLNIGVSFHVDCYDRMSLPCVGRPSMCLLSRIWLCSAVHESTVVVHTAVKQLPDERS